ncbi:MAG: hypothetical protein ACRELW_22090 [Candidatus Rokuibacteriota bacterium]
MEKVPTASQGDELPIIHSTHAPCAETDAVNVSRQTKVRKVRIGQHLRRKVYQRQGYHPAHGPAPMSRQALERELNELPANIAQYQRELDAMPQENRERRERLAWQIQRVMKRMAEIQARLTAAGG